MRFHLTATANSDPRGCTRACLNHATTGESDTIGSTRDEEYCSKAVSIFFGCYEKSRISLVEASWRRRSEVKNKGPHAGDAVGLFGLNAQPIRTPSSCPCISRQPPRGIN